MTIEERVRNYIESHHLNKASLAKALNMNIDSFYGIVHGRRKMSANELIGFCDEVDLTVDEFLNKSGT